MGESNIRSSEAPPPTKELPARTEQLSLVMPSWATTPSEKVLCALWMTGGVQCFCNLTLLTGLDHAVVVKTVRDLNDEQVVIRRLPDVAENDPRTLIELL